MNGLGAISGASFGGAIADLVGWRFCFLLQVPISVGAIICGCLAINNHPVRTSSTPSAKVGSVWKQVDITGSFLLVLGLGSQLGALSLGGNEYAWTAWPVITMFVASVVLLAVFGLVECRTKAVPIIPMRLFRGVASLSLIVCNTCLGLAAYGVRILP